MTQPGKIEEPNTNSDLAPDLRKSVRGIESLPAVLNLMQAQISSVISHLRDSSGELETESVSKLRITMEQLQKVTAATETAAHGILDGIDRSLGLVDELDRIDTSADPQVAAKRAQVKDELRNAFNCVQFQDVTSQQIRHASSLLIDMEHRFNSLVRALDPATINKLTERLAQDEAHFDPDATYGDREHRQAQADSVFK